MATRYALKHRTTGEYLASRPDLVAGDFRQSLDVAEAASWSTMSEATLIAIEALEDFTSAWDVVPVQVAMFSDKPAPVGPTAGSDTTLYEGSADA